MAGIHQKSAPPTGAALTTGQIAKICQVNFRTVIRWIRRGLLPGYQLPGRGDNRVLVADLIPFLKQHHMPVPMELLNARNTLLIVDDDAAMAASLERVLRREGYTTFVATDGFQAGVLLEKHRPALVTLDLNMPGIDGFEMIEFIRENNLTEHTRILIVSGLTNVKMEEAVALGADDYMYKPIDSEELLERIRRLLA